MKDNTKDDMEEKIENIKKELENAIFEDHEGNIEHVDFQKHQLVNLLDRSYLAGRESKAAEVRNEIHEIVEFIANEKHWWIHEKTVGMAQELTKMLYEVLSALDKTPSRYMEQQIEIICQACIRAGCHSKLIRFWMDNRWQSEVEVLTLADVLLALKDHNDAPFGVTSEGIIENEAYMKVASWDLLRDDLTKQSPETIAFLCELLANQQEQ